ncbi:MAG: alpha/beta hydrolase [Nocardiopsaceae bacterium]|jgi:pimeloyl-ACP methyl ester carboxylesterase|nr:alpha/beta hydrolase [Nocardiopsaceae bacterium]
MTEAIDRDKRTFILIPGAGGTAWYWHRVVPLLKQAGHQAIAVDLPGDDPDAGLAEYARLTASAADGYANVVLVGQSLGGFTAPMAAMKVDLRSMVFINAMIPRPGETPGEWWDATGWEHSRLAAAERGHYPAEFDLETYFLHDVPPDIAAAGEKYQRPESDAAFASACDFTAWPQVPIRVATGADDRFFPASFEQAIARDRLGVEADILPGGHLNALSQPTALTDYLLAASA